MKKIKNITVMIIIQFISMNILFSCVSIFFISFLKDMQSSTNNSDGFLQLLDNYESDNYSIWDFLKEDNALNIMNDTYQSIISDNTLDYYEFSDQTLEFIGEYKGDLSLVDGYDESFINQPIDNYCVTPLKSLQLSEKMMKKFNLDGMLSSGRFFTTDEFVLNKDLSIPVLVGEKYKSLFKLNDTFNAHYLSDGNVKCEIIGFIKEDTKINIVNNTFDLNNYIVFPSFNLDFEKMGNNENLYKTLLMLKCEGYLHFNNFTDKIQTINKLENISINTGFEFNSTYFSHQKQYVTNWEISLTASIVILVIGIIIIICLIVFLLYYFQKQIINKIKFKSKKEKTIFKIEVWFISLIIIILTYILSYFLSSLIFSSINYSFIFSYIKLYINIFLFIVFVISWFLIDLRTNKVKLWGQ